LLKRSACKKEPQFAISLKTRDERSTVEESRNGGGALSGKIGEEKRLIDPLGQKGSTVRHAPRLRDAESQREGE